MHSLRRLRLLLRLLAIRRALVRHGLDELVWRAHLFRPLAWIRKLVPRRRQTLPLGARLRLTLEELGPIFVKFGQALSVRPDLVGPEVADELAKLQDAVPPFPAEQAVEMLERAFGRPVAALFAEFDRTPLAAASIAQVHAAKLADGSSVVVKILRPNVAALIRRDVEVLYSVAGLTERYWPEARRLHPTEVVAEFERTLAHELDLMREAANAAQLKRNFAGSDLLYVPAVHWDWCRPNVLTTERIVGIQIDDLPALRNANADIQRLAENGVEIFFTQVFRHNFFHADMHPGNIFVDVTNPDRPKYAAVDFGIMGTLDARDQHYLAENFVAFFRRDYRRVAQLHVDSGWVPPSTRVNDLEAAVRSVCEPIFNKPLKDISFGFVLMRLFQVARQYNMEVQPQLVLLEKTLLQIEGLGRMLYPELDLWKTAQPVLENWLKQRRDPRTQLKALVAAWPDISEDLSVLPRLLHRAVRRADMDDAEEQRGRRVPVVRRPSHINTAGGVQRAIAAGAFLIAGALWTGLAEPAWIGWLGVLAGLVLMVVRRGD